MSSALSKLSPHLRRKSSFVVSLPTVTTDFEAENSCLNDFISEAGMIPQKEVASPFPHVHPVALSETYDPEKSEIFGD